MAFEIYLKDNIINEIHRYIAISQPITTTTLNIANGLLTKGSHSIPIDHILFIKEI